MVDFTCTRTKCPSCSTAKSSRAVSPHGLVTHNPCSAARVIKRSSAHSPRSLGCLIFIPLFFMKFLSPTLFGRHSCPPDFSLTPTKTRPFPAAPISPIPPDDDIQLNRRQHATSAEIRLFPISGISLRVARAPSPANGRTLPRPRSYSCDAAASVLVRSGREGTASAVPQPKTFSFLSFRTALAVRNLLLPRAGCPGLAIFETWETKGSGTLTRRLAEGSLACIFRKIRVSILPSDAP